MIFNTLFSFMVILCVFFTFEQGLFRGCSIVVYSSPIYMKHFVHRSGVCLAVLGVGNARAEEKQQQKTAGAPVGIDAECDTSLLPDSQRSNSASWYRCEQFGLDHSKFVHDFATLPKQPERFDGPRTVACWKPTGKRSAAVL